MKYRPRLTFSLVACLLVVGSVRAQENTNPLRALTLDDYAQWQRLASPTLSPEGDWVAFVYQPNDGDTGLHLRATGSDKAFVIERGNRPTFSEDGRWASYSVTAEESDDKPKNKEASDEAVEPGVELLDLQTGRKRRFAAATGSRFAKRSSHQAVQMPRGDTDAEHRGADLLLVELETGRVENIGNVSSYAFDDSGEYLAYLIDAAHKAGNGIYLRRLADGTTSVLDSEGKDYSQLTWQKDGQKLACLRGEEVIGKEEKRNTLLAFSDLELPDFGRVDLDPTPALGLTEGYVLSEKYQPQWSVDGMRIFVGIRAQQDEPDEVKDDEKRSNVEVWHWLDERLQAQQEVQSGRDRDSTLLSVVHLAGDPRLAQLATDAMRTVRVDLYNDWALGQDNSLYRGDMDQEGGRSDYYRVELASGERRLLERSVRRGAQTSPDGRWFIFERNGEIYAKKATGGDAINLSKDTGIDFTDMTSDRTGEARTYGVAGWSSDGRFVVLNHRYDVYCVPLNTTGNGELRAQNLTMGLGTERQIRFRYQRLDADERFIDLDSELCLSAYGDRTKHSGYYAVKLGQQPRALIYEDRMVGGLQKAEQSDRVVFQKQTFVDSPNLFVSTTSFTESTKVSDTNPQQAEFLWSPGRVLVDFVDTRGNELQATLALPAGYEEGKRYPMVIYFYEKMSQRHHQYSMPAYDDRPHMSTYASNGYLVLMPDIVSAPGKPGSSALDDVTSAARRVIELGYADPERIGLQGHSWGGYESSFIVTQTDMFACVVTGAPLTNLVSMHNILYGSTGNTNAPQIQWGQGRMDSHPWNNLEGYIEESPMHQAMKITTPFMILHGTEDGAVDWNQGLEFYVAAKRLGKEVILLSYEGEPHHLRRRENQLDFQRRMQQYFDHHLKDAEAPAWLREGLDYLDRDREKR